MLGSDTITKNQQAEHGRSLPNWMSPSQSLLDKQMQRTQSPVCDNVCQLVFHRPKGWASSTMPCTPIPRISTHSWNVGMLEFNEEAEPPAEAEASTRRCDCSEMFRVELRNPSNSIAPLHDSVVSGKGPQGQGQRQGESKSQGQVEWQVQLTVVHAKCLQFGIYVEREDLTKEEETILN